MYKKLEIANKNTKLKNKSLYVDRNSNVLLVGKKTGRTFVPRHWCPQRKKTPTHYRVPKERPKIQLGVDSEIFRPMLDDSNVLLNHRECDNANQGGFFSRNVSNRGLGTVPRGIKNHRDRLHHEMTAV